ncbi:SOS response-associated peptidase [Microvirga antarctica]|uniref:SOS response-associated peptidase n=1 Tax=Microvirga antarctica TaxID=2819233 RepID=UPI001B30C796|nr:SOS response-associated peptidase [Microvirga antarctica]
MCGRFAITLLPEVYRDFFDYSERPDFPARFNIAPTQPVPIVVEDRGGRHFQLVRWGFLPEWAKDPKDFPLLVNARGETLDVKPTFKAALKRRRCIFLADGFYEWQRHGGLSAPYLIRRRDRAPLPMAGLWETYSDASGGEIDTAAIITTDANGVVGAIHDRMPVILSKEDMAAWLDPTNERTTDAMRLVRPCPEDWLEMVPVSRRVNAVANDDAGLMEAVAVPEGPPAAPAKKRASRNDDAQGQLF